MGQTPPPGIHSTKLSSKYTLERWQAIKLIEDAYKKRIQDTIIVKLEQRVSVLEADRLRTHKSFVDELDAERSRTEVQRDLVTYESSLKEIARLDAKRYKRQRNWLGVGIAAFIGYKVARVFVPP